MYEKECTMDKLSLFNIYIWSGQKIRETLVNRGLFIGNEDQTDVAAL